MSTQPSTKWVLYYQSFLAVGAVLFFFTFFDSYIVTQQLVSSPIGWVLPYCVLTIPLFLIGKIKAPDRLILIWGLGYLLMSVISFLAFPTSEASSRALIDRIFSSVFLLVTTSLFADKKIINRVQYTVAIATMIGVLNNCYQIIRPDAFSGLVEGRAAGFYMDPNDCCYALVLGMIVTVNLFPQKFRIPWVLGVGIGVALTFSRGGGLSWFLTIVLMGLSRIIAYKQSGLWIFGSGIVLLGSLLLGSNDGMAIGADNEDLLERIDGLINGETLEDPSALERKGIMGKAWEMFLEHPTFGQGIGSASDYNITGFPVSTHNMYLLHAAEYGMIGLPILPFILYATIYQTRGEMRKISGVFVIFILLSSLFSHTVLDQRSYFIAFALLSAIGKATQQDSTQNQAQPLITST